MNLTHIRLRSSKGKIVGTLLCTAFAVTLLLFFVDRVDGQATGPQTSRLIGTIQSNKFIGAVFSDSKGEQSFYRVFDTLPDGSKLVAVRSDSISLKGADGISYDMYIAHDTKNVSSVTRDVPADPFAGAIRKTPEERKPSAYEMRRQNRLGKQNSKEE